MQYSVKQCFPRPPKACTRLRARTAGSNTSKLREILVDSTGIVCVLVRLLVRSP
jgi:hypothetical protein